MDEQNILGTTPMARLVAKMSLPLIFSMMVQATYNIVDGIFVARIGDGVSAISAVGIAFPIQLMMIAFSNGLGVGMNSLISRRLGAGQTDQPSRIAGNGMLMAIILSLVFVLFGIFGTNGFFRLSTENEEIISMGTSYLSICCCCSFGIFIAIIGERLLQVTGKPNLSMVTQLSGAVINIILDPILILGKFGLPAMGINGAAVATVAGQIISACIALTLNALYNKTIVIPWKKLRLNRDVVSPVVKVGFPVTITVAMTSVMAFGMNKLLADSIVAVAVFTIYSRLFTFLIMPLQGLMQGLVPIIGFNYGAGNGERVKKAIIISICCSVALMLFGTVVFMALPSQLLNLFSSDGSRPEMIAMGISALRTISITFLFAGPAIVMSSIYQGTGNGVPSMIHSLFSKCIILLPTAWLFLKLFGTDKVWYAFCISETLTFIIILVIFVFQYKKRVVPILPPKEQECSQPG